VSEEEIEHIRKWLENNPSDFKYPCHKENGKECKNYDCYFNHEGFCAIDDIDVSIDDFPYEILEGEE
jgi:hypothetical protein